ncbi:RNA polymerase sigma factor [Klenkia sp. PcliD-1-E]|uniref:RNA polymerase sigma factor n=1 Tax=Klenkia sp. PcliD-1-E TaxID=2954492 RepID=UPI0020974A39|nr:RNA polymerase sigma factor [Klenkia sp. PcliD-1-E]MCO7220924.1 RNA polymerase sigma factor [Klenkia sp. PcliD-1-E]
MVEPPAPVAEAIDRAHREEWARLVAGLTRRFGDLDLAEEAAAEAFLVALTRWPDAGVPASPGGWLTTTATRKAIDRLRRESRREDKYREALLVQDDTAPLSTGAVTDDRLRLVFTCCHPALSMEARVALTLRMVGGLSVAEIARAFLVQETTMAQRITRAKAKIRAARIPFRVPAAADVQARLTGALAVVYLVFNEGYLTTGGDDPVRVELTREAIRLGRLLHLLVPEDGEVEGLLALMLLSEARRPARFAADGTLVTLAEQDRSRWDQTLIAGGHALVRHRLSVVAAGGPAPGSYQLQAAINAVHTDAATASETDWSQVVALYDQMVLVDSSPVVRLNRAVAVAELDGPDIALAELDQLAELLDHYGPFHVARAEVLRRLHRHEPAGHAYDRAITLTQNTVERRHLGFRRDELGWHPPSAPAGELVARRVGVDTVVPTATEGAEHLDATEDPGDPSGPRLGRGWSSPTSHRSVTACSGPGGSGVPGTP